MASINKSQALQKKKISGADIVLVIIFIILSIIFIYPVWYCVITSISNATLIQTQGAPLILPLGFSLDAYSFIFQDAEVMRFYANSIFYSFGGAAISLLLTAMMAFPFLFDDLIGKKWFNVFIVIPMFFGGGLLPTYFLMTALGLQNTVWVMLIPGAVGGYTVILFRTFFKSIPAALRESAYIDGAGHYRVLFTIMLPLSKAMLATFGLFGVVGKWNDWFTPFLYLTDTDLQPIQLYLRSMLVTATSMTQSKEALLNQYENMAVLSVKSASVILTIAPIMCVYPFLQKYFAKGVMVGAIKS